MSERRPSTIWRVLLFAGMVGSTAGASCGTPPEKLEYCDPEFCENGSVYLCNNWAGRKLVECHVSSFGANFWCQQKGGGAAYEPDCTDFDGASDSETGSDTTDAGTEDTPAPWEPGAHVVFDERQGAYLVDASFVADLEANLSLLENDSAILVESSTGGYYLLANVARGDLADVMGLQSGDVIVSVNGYDLGTVDGQIAAYNNLQGEDELTLRFERSGRVLSTTYILIGGSPR